MMDVKKMLKPAGIAGGIMGFVGSIPGLNCLNVFCCLLVVVGGAGAAYLLKKKHPKLELVDGAAVGALSGIAYAVVATVFGTIFSLIMTAVFGTAFAPMSMMDQGFAGPMQGMGMSAASTLVGAVIGFVFSIVINPIFGAVGGVLYVKFTEGKKAPGVPADAKNVTPDAGGESSADQSVSPAAPPKA